MLQYLFGEGEKGFYFLCNATIYSISFNLAKHSSPLMIEQLKIDYKGMQLFKIASLHMIPTSAFCNTEANSTSLFFLASVIASSQAVLSKLPIAFRYCQYLLFTSSSYMVCILMRQIRSQLKCFRDQSSLLQKERNSSTQFVLVGYTFMLSIRRTNLFAKFLSMQILSAIILASCILFLNAIIMAYPTYFLSCSSSLWRLSSKAIRQLYIISLRCRIQIRSMHTQDWEGFQSLEEDAIIPRFSLHSGSKEDRMSYDSLERPKVKEKRKKKQFTSLKLKTAESTQQQVILKPNNITHVRVPLFQNENLPYPAYFREVYRRGKRIQAHQQVNNYVYQGIQIQQLIRILVGQSVSLFNSTSMTKEQMVSQIYNKKQVVSNRKYAQTGSKSTVQSKQMFIRKVNKLLHRQKDSILQFNSAFEGGNLQSAAQKHDIHSNCPQYELRLEADTNSRGHRQWFYFAVKANISHRVRLVILPFRKRTSLFTQGLYPYCSHDLQSWQPSGTDISYSVHGFPHHSLSFTYCFKKGQIIYFASCIPYSYSLLQAKLNSTIHPKWQRLTLCRTLSGLDIPLLKIHSQTPSNEYVVVVARTHPGQTSASWVMDGIMSAVKKIALSVNLYLIPMFNPDGVVLGNYRTGVLGTDLNRQFQSAPADLYPEIHAIKALIKNIKREGNVVLFLDLHGHSSKLGSFIYSPPQGTLSGEFEKLREILAYSPLFTLKNCSSHCDPSVHSTSRVYFQRRENIYAATCENSLGLGVNQKQLNTADWQEFGIHLIKSIIMCLDPDKSQQYCTAQRKEEEHFTWQRSKTEKQKTSIDISREQIKIFHSSQRLEKKVIIKDEGNSSNDEDQSQEDLTVEKRRQLEAMVRKQLKTILPERTVHQKKKSRQSQHFKPRRIEIKNVNTFKLYKFGEENTLEEWEEQKKLLFKPKILSNDTLSQGFNIKKPLRYYLLDNKKRKNNFQSFGQIRPRNLSLGP